ncbi:MAG TPA: metalloregulator ArsR/SmtB family transcription factor [Usitatibacter sp.]|jgi:ArsR family transcriptional regulator, arsenate/arsenite/antimonite-responsive transcriptional repressor|nr:metalloregulator ArsR/SmtB family transcription factor [Usitatibacter sp.]
METATAISSLAALAQETRLGIFRLLVGAGPSGLSVGEIGAELKVAPATLSFHLKELAYAGLIASRQEGRFIFYSANFERMNALVGFLTDHCCSREACCGPNECAPLAKRPAPAGKSRSGARNLSRGDRGASKA